MKGQMLRVSARSAWWILAPEGDLCALCKKWKIYERPIEEQENWKSQKQTLLVKKIIFPPRLFLLWVKRTNENQARSRGSTTSKELKTFFGLKNKKFAARQREREREK